MMASLLRFFARRVLRSPPAPLRVVALAAAVLMYGTTGFLYFELPENPALTWQDAIWYSIVTVTTVGYGDFYPVSTGGRFIVAMPLMFFGIGLLGFILSLAASALVEAKTKELHGMSDSRATGHLVIFNFPGVGKLESLIRELRSDPQFGKQREIVLVDESLAELPPELVKLEVHFVSGNPARDQTLDRANVDRATQAIVLAKTPGDPRSDDQNIAITLAIEARNPDVETVVECVDVKTEELLRKAGCDSIVCTSRFDSAFLSHELLNPGAQEVIQELTSNLHGEQIYVTEYSGKKRVAFNQVAKACQRLGHLAIGLRHEGATQLNVTADVQVKPGDQVISIGPERMPALEDV